VTPSYAVADFADHAVSLLKPALMFEADARDTVGMTSARLPIGSASEEA
jgi:hypothetical protein